MLNEQTLETIRKYRREAYAKYRKAQEEIVSLIWKLQLYYHEGNTVCNLSLCPEKCPVGHKLDLDTAIACEAAKRGKLLLYHPIEGSEVELQCLVYGIYSLKQTVSLHAEKYKNLFDLVADLSETIWEMHYAMVDFQRYTNVIEGKAG